MWLHQAHFLIYSICFILNNNNVTRATLHTTMFFFNFMVYLQSHMDAKDK